MSDKTMTLTSQIETPEFCEWFDGSKVIDKHGKPLVVYHATPENFKVFDTSSFKSHFGNLNQAKDRVNELASMGIDSKRGYAVKIIPVYLSIKNPFRVNDLGDNWLSPSAFSSEIENTLGLPDNSTHDEFDAIYAKTKSDTETVAQMLKNRGYDGIVYRNEFEGISNPLGKGGIVPTGKHSGDSFIPFEPTQIQHVVDNV